MTHEIAPHLGFEATMMMRDWLQVFPEIQSMTLLLKQVLFTHSLNKAYTGGISSFTLMVLIVVFCKLKRGNRKQVQKSTTSEVELLMGFLKFFN